MAASRIRFYESEGLLEQVDRRANGYRVYSKEALPILEIIKAAQHAGFSLGEIKALLPNGPRRWNQKNVIESLEKKAGDITLLQEQLKQTKGDLLRVVAFIKTRPPGGACADDVREALNAIRSADRGRKATRRA